ncbi:uncharacterized protein BT62DRAFT_1074385 [Guyanagaster necrorhizus]|uniref:DUF6534 domain-containing protein n=1 Tax=Guyanagaster necrorhizus TaxID=856835 RepID=A0A9P8AUU3_9AGAR|nr:uncharacterized protein BT62DRAFT_1074385 [Guyanagaster necrorhizus MCA 3950]KAG7448864.1 hypothetical protein BT62DRAFT_1074385 [Guyanagaster necrorhizus MCA 3950]
MALILDTSVGALLAASWLNLILYTSQVALSVYCLRHLTITRSLRSWILASLVIDGACSIVDVAHVYKYLVIGEASLYQELSWTVPSAGLLTYTSASIAQAFFCYRYWTLTGNKWIAGLIIFLIVAHMLCNLVTNIYLLAHPSDLVAAVPLLITNAVICAATDVTIAGSLIWACWHMQTPYIQTRNILRRVMVQALTCGFTTAISTSFMILFLFTAWNASYTLFAVLGRIYSLTILITLMLLKAMGRSDPSTIRIDGDGGSEPASKSPVCELCFKHTSDTDSTGKMQTSSNESENIHPSTPLQFGTLAKACIHTV